MAFAEDFVTCMHQQAGNTNIDVSHVTDPSHFVPSLQYVLDWFNQLPQVTQQFIDTLLGNQPVNHLLESAGLTNGLEQLLHGFNASQGWSLSTILQWCISCAQQAEQAQPAQ